jgi:hypothetical protein
MILPIVIYILLMIAYIYARPSLSFHRNGSTRSFGVQKGQTLFPIWVIAILIAVFVGFVYHLLAGSAEVIELRLIE